MQLQDYQLGELLDSFGWSRRRGKVFLFMSLFLLPFSLLMSIFIIGIPGLIFCIYCFCRACQMMTAKKVVFLYEHGVVDARKKQVQVIPYEQIRQLTMQSQKQYLTTVIGMPIGYLCTNHRYVIETQDGNKIQFLSDLQHRDRFGELLGQQMVSHQLPQVLQAYNQGKSLNFGRLQLTQTGLSTPRKTLPWNDIGSVEIVDGTYGQGVAITTKQPNAKGQPSIWLDFGLKEITNPHLLQALVRAIVTTSHSFQS